MLYGNALLAGNYAGISAEPTAATGCKTIGETGVVPGIFRRGLTLPTKVLEYGLQGTINAKISEKSGLPNQTDGELECSDEGL